MLANPPTMIASNSLMLADARNGLTMSGASVCPTKILAAEDNVSAPLQPMLLAMIQASPCTTYCMTPLW